MSVCNVICTFHMKIFTKFKLVATNTNMDGKN